MRLERTAVWTSAVCSVPMRPGRRVYAAQWSTGPAGIARVPDYPQWAPVANAGGGVMVRRSGVASADSGTESAMYGDESPSWPGTDRPAPVAKAPWSGGGGRWTVWPMRIILWAAILVIGYRGIMAIALNEKPASSGSGTAATAGGPTSQFPVTLAEA